MHGEKTVRRTSKNNARSEKNKRAQLRCSENKKMAGMQPATRASEKSVRERRGCGHAQGHATHARTSSAMQESSANYP